MKTKNAILLLVLLAGIAHASTSDSEGKSDFSRLKAENLTARLIDVHESDDKFYFSVSPDGNYYAALTRDRNFIQIIDSRTKEVVLEDSLQQKTIYPDYFSWSPDSKRALFTENFLRLFHDSDLWVMDIEEGEVLHLFPDEVEFSMFSTNEMDGYSEFQPVWSPDNHSIYLTRFHYGSGLSHSGIVRDYRQGEFTDFPQLTTIQRFVTWTDAFWRKSHIYFTRNATRIDDPVNGIFRTSTTGENIETIMESDPELGSAILCDVDRNESFALAVYFSRNEQLLYPPAGQDSLYHVINLKDFSHRTLKKSETPDSQFRTEAAVFSPDGRKILSINFDSRQVVYTLEIRDTKGDKTYRLFESHINDGGYPLTSGFFQFKPHLFWTEDDRIFVVSGPGGKILEFELSR